MIENNQVTVIHGPTGSGKTTQVPQYILDSYAQKGRYCNIIVTQPRRIAAASIATRVCHERSWNLGGICGYQVLLKTCSVLLYTIVIFDYLKIKGLSQAKFGILCNHIFFENVSLYRLLLYWIGQILKKNS